MSSKNVLVMVSYTVQTHTLNYVLYLSLLPGSNGRVPCGIKITNLAESTNCPKEAFICCGCRSRTCYLWVMSPQ